MRCILCKKLSDGSTSVEHIVPESLGNTEHVLPVGWVCDGCNNYVSREVEGPFLNSSYGRAARFEMRVPSRRKRVPPVVGFHPQSLTKVQLYYSDADGLSVGAAEGEDEVRWVASMQQGDRGSIWLPHHDLPVGDYVATRFIGKVAIEVLAYKALGVPSANDELVDKTELDELRRYVRFGEPRSVWPVNIRRIYPADSCFDDPVDGKHQVLHEWTILPTPAGEYYAVIAILGVEYAINLGGPEISGFHQWLSENAGRSPLY